MTIILQKSKLDASNFDIEFTGKAPKISPTDSRVLDAIDQSGFQGFTYVGPVVTC